LAENVSRVCAAGSGFLVAFKTNPPTLALA
jgi:hypothetical protein